MATRVIQLLPCLCCRHGEQAVEEIAAVYLSALHGEPPPRLGALEGVAGVLMFGISTAYMFFVMQLYLPEIHAIRRH